MGANLLTPPSVHVGTCAYEVRDVCQDDGFASGWEVMTAARRFQHRLEVFMDEWLAP